MQSRRLFAFLLSFISLLERFTRKMVLQEAFNLTQMFKTVKNTFWGFWIMVQPTRSYDLNQKI